MSKLRVLKKVLVGALGTVGVVGAGVAVYAFMQASAFDESMQKVYDVPLPVVARSADPTVLARGKHLTEAVAACASTACHGADLAGGKPVDVGPIGTFAGPNITGAGLGAAYSDAELARLIRHGVTKSGRSVRFMPVQEVNWLSDADVAAIVSYVRTVPAVEKPNGATQIKLLGKVLDRRGDFVLDVARHIDHAKIETAPPPSPTVEYGRFAARLCTGCHGEHLSGGKLPGAPPSLPIPLNLTSHETGLKGWTYDDFDKLLTAGVRKNGKPLDPFMPIESFGKLDTTEKKAIWAYLQSLPPTPFGNR